MYLSPGLYIVATPIGNLGDITLRAIQVLQHSNYILCEDTRIARVLLQKYDIRTKIILYNDHSNDVTRNNILSLINQGQVISLISDAGTPMICDPGYKLVNYLQQHKTYIDVIPGACSIIAALCLASMPTDKFIFLGFLPKTNSQKTMTIQQVSNVFATLVFFDTAPRILHSLQIALTILGNRRCAIVREITKIHQEVIKDTIQNVIDQLNIRDILKGELVIIIEKAENSPKNELIIQKLQLLQNAGFSNRDCAKIVATLFDVTKTYVYDILIGKN